MKARGDVVVGLLMATVAAAVETRARLKVAQAKAKRVLQRTLSSSQEIRS